MVAVQARASEAPTCHLPVPEGPPMMVHKGLTAGHAEPRLPPAPFSFP